MRAIALGRTRRQKTANALRGIKTDSKTIQRRTKIIMAYRKALETITDLNDCIVKLETKHQESLEQERRGYEYENRKRAIKVAATQGMLAAALDILEKV